MVTWKSGMKWENNLKKLGHEKCVLVVLCEERGCVSKKLYQGEIFAFMRFCYSLNHKPPIHGV